MRTYTFLLTLLIAAVSAVAQDWKPVDEHKYNDETIVYATLWDREVRLSENDLYYIVGVFIDGECRALARSGYSYGNPFLYTLRVVGDREADKNKKMEFRVYDSQTGFEFNLSAERDVFFTGESEGVPSDPIFLSFIPPTSLTLSDIYIYKGITVNLYDYLHVLPENCTLPNGISWQVTGEIAAVEGNMLKALQTGTTTYTLLINGKAVASAKVIIEAGELPKGFIVTFEPVAAGESKVMTLTPIPEDASVDANWYSLDMTGKIKGWKAAECELVSTEPLTYRVTPLYPGWIEVCVNKDSIPLYDTKGERYVGFEAAAPLRLQKGWQWLTNAFNSIAADAFQTAYDGDALTEIRTQEHLLYNDPEWGYFGTLMDEGLGQNIAYKVLMAEGPHLSRLFGTRFATPLPVVLDGTWTWLPLPFWYDRRLGHAFTNTDLPAGLTLISKEKGSAEWSGTEWIGDLKVLPAGESLLCYHPTDQSFLLTFADETAMEQGHEQPAFAVNRGTWEYDASSYRDNMTMVAVIEDLPFPDEYTIGAFVGSECRGSGAYTDGYYFITIHTDPSERVRFVLRHETTGMEYPIDEWVHYKMRLGSTAHPVPLHSSELATGISQLGADKTGFSADYDLMGRRVTPSTGHGILLRRMEDGRVRKVHVR